MVVHRERVWLDSGVHRHPVGVVHKARSLGTRMEATALVQAAEEVYSRVKHGEDRLTWGHRGGLSEQLQTNPREPATSWHLGQHAREGEDHAHSAGHHPYSAPGPMSTCKSWD